MSDVKDIHAQVGSLDSFSRQVFQNAGVDTLSSGAATRAMSVSYTHLTLPTSAIV